MTTTYSVTRDQVILSALRKLGVVEPSDTSSTIDANTLVNSAQSLNLMVKNWATSGIKLWTIEEQSLTLVSGQTSYVIGPSGPGLVANKPLKLIQAFIRNTSVSPQTDMPLVLISKQEYNVLGSKFSTGTTNSIFMDVGNTTSTAYVFLTPDTLAASTYVLHMIVQRHVNDLTLGTDIPEFPIEWVQALVWGLADQLAIEYGLPVNHRQELLMKAEKYKNDLEAWDVESYSSYFQPDMRMYAHR